MRVATHGASLVALAAALSLVTGEPPARAAGPTSAQGADACLSAPVDGQTQRRADKLLQARDSFTICARRTCPARIVQECTRWLHEVDDILPSLVAVARDAAGNDLLDAQVSIDGAPPADVSARSIPLDPGPHKLAFHRQGSVDVEQDVLLREGEKARTVAVVLRPPPAAAPPPPPPAVVIERPIPTVVWVLGGVAVAGGALFATFGALGVAERGSDCAPAGCTQTQKDSIESKFHVGDLALAIGAGALVAGGVFFFTRPTAESPAPPAAALSVRPSPGGASLMLGARF